jgi:hypothetical protein
MRIDKILVVRVVDASCGAWEWSRRITIAQLAKRTRVSGERKCAPISLVQSQKCAKRVDVLQMSKRMVNRQSCDFGSIMIT